MTQDGSILRRKRTVVLTFWIFQISRLAFPPGIPKSETHTHFNGVELDKEPLTWRKRRLAE